jgi:hypothetical protein
LPNNGLEAEIMGRASDLAKRFFVGAGHLTVKAAKGTARIISEENARYQERKRREDERRRYYAEKAREGEAYGYGLERGRIRAVSDHYQKQREEKYWSDAPKRFEKAFDSNLFTGVTSDKEWKRRTSKFERAIDDNLFAGTSASKKKRKRNYSF